MLQYEAKGMTKMDEQAFRLMYPKTPNDVIAEQFEMTEAAVRLYASRRGMRKDPDYVRVIQAQRMRGRAHSAQTREKIRSRALQRTPISGQTRERLQQRPVKNRGAAHYKWKGGKPWQRFKSPEYQAWRQAVLERDSYTCQHCGRLCNKAEKGLAAHHFKPYSQFPDLRFGVSNGLTLCRSCDMTLHGKSIVVKLIPCSCGCGELIQSKDIYGRARRYVNHHGRRPPAT